MHCMEMLWEGDESRCRACRGAQCLAWRGISINGSHRYYLQPKIPVSLRVIANASLCVAICIEYFDI